MNNSYNYVFGGTSAAPSGSAGIPGGSDPQQQPKYATDDVLRDNSNGDDLVINTIVLSVDSYGNISYDYIVANTTTGNYKNYTENYLDTQCYRYASLLPRTAANIEKFLGIQRNNGITQSDANTCQHKWLKSNTMPGFSEWCSICDARKK